jgi:hypothetical protein
MGVHEASVAGIPSLKSLTWGKSALEIAASLSRDEQLRLIQELTVRAAQAPTSEEDTSVLALCGLGQEIWRRMDAQEYVRRERSSWNG